MIAALLCVVAGSGMASTQFEQDLQEADRIRSSDRDRFSALLNALEATVARADPAQRQRLRYLQIYSMVFYGNKMEEAVDEAVALYGEAIETDLKFRTGALITNTSALRRNFGEGLRYLDRTVALRNQVQDKDIRHDGINAVAILYNQLGQYRLGLRFAEETLADQPSARPRCFAGYLRLQALYGRGSQPLDDPSILAVIDHCDSLGEKAAANLSRGLLARKWAGQGRRGEAIALLQRHMAEVEATGYPRLIGEIRSLLAELLLANGERAAAQTQAESAVATSVGSPTSLPLVMAYKVLYEVAALRQDPVAALSHYRNYAEADKAYLNEVKARELVYQMSRQENVQKTQQIALLDQQNKVLQLQQRVQTQSNQNMGLIVLLLASLLAGLGLWAYRVKRLHVSLRRVAETDALTGISNRHQFTRQAERSLSQCERAGESVAIIMFDLDRFKAINDAYGHDAGDWVLKQVAEACSGLCRRIDHFGRIGGEEFAILLHGCELKAAVRLAEDCRIRLANIETRDSGHAFAITASFGVSSSRYSGYGLARLMSHADLVLYRAKREGRNRVSAFTGDLPLVSPVASLLPLPVQTATDVDVAVAQSPGAGRPGRGGTS